MRWTDKTCPFPLKNGRSLAEHADHAIKSADAGNLTVDSIRTMMYSVYIQYIHYTGGEGITIHLNTASGQPLYEQIVAQIRLQVLTGVLRDGDQLPSIRALARELQVSIITTKRAYEELEREGILAVSAGRGSFVRAGGIEGSRQTQLGQLTEQLQAAAAQARVLGLDADRFGAMARDQFIGGAGPAGKEEPS